MTLPLAPDALMTPAEPVAAAPAPVASPTLAGIYQWCRSVRPIFIVGLARSGTSMLQVAFAQHRSMFAIANCRETFVFLRPEQPYQTPVHKPTRAYLRDRSQLVALRALKKQLQAEHGTLSDDDLVALFFWFAGHHVYPGQAPLEKTPGHLRRLDMIFRIFPQARVLVCSRGPLEVTASYRKRLAQAVAEGTPPEKTRWLDRTVDEMIAIFDGFTRMVREATPRYGAQMYMAPYDWLVSQPEQALRTLCHWADMDFQAPMVASQGAPALPAAAVAQSPASGKSHTIQKRGSSVNSLLSPEEIERLQTACAPWLAEWSLPGCLADPRRPHTPTPLAA